MSSGRKKTFVLLLLVVFLSFCNSVISFEEERKITAVGKLSGGGFRGSFRGSSGGSARGGGASHPRSSGNGHRTIIPAVVAGNAGSANARSNERKHNAAAIGHAQPIYISLATAMLCFTILLFL